MDFRTGVFIVIEGSDGSGKKTQFQLLSNRLQQSGYIVKEYDFPRYDQASSHFVRKYLAGDYGDAESINPYTASMFYALDRYEASFDIRESLKEGNIVLANRYVGSNMAHQGSKFASEGEKRGFFMWEDSLEFQLLGIPRPDLNIFLSVPVNVSQKLILDRAKTTGRELDEHERNIGHLKRSVDSYNLLCRLFPKDYLLIECTEKGQLKSINDIGDKVWDSVSPLLTGLSKDPEAKTKSRTAHQVSESIALTNTSKTSSMSKHKLTLLEILNAHAHTSSPIISHLDFATSPAVAALLRENSQQHQHLEKKLKDFETKFGSKISTHKLAPKRQKSVVQQILRSLQPLYCLSDTDEETKSKLMPGTDDEKLQEMLERVTAHFSNYQSKTTHEDRVVDLNNYQPKNEFDLLSPVLFHSSLIEVEALKNSMDEAGYDKKVDILNRILSDPSSMNYGLVLSSAHYQLQLTCSLAQFDSLLNYLRPTSFIAQPLTPALGYSVPAILDELGLSEEYSECFDASVALFSRMQASNNDALAAYALLGGHRQRFLVNLTLAAVTELIEHSQQANVPGSIKTIGKELVLQLSAAHPLIGEHLTALNKKAKRTK